MTKQKQQPSIIHKQVDANTGTATGNPFLDSIELFLATDNIAAQLTTSPMDRVDVGNLSLQQRLDILDRMQEEYFEATTESVNIATRLYRLIRKGYLNRNPTRPSVRRMTMEIAGYAGKELSELPWFATYAKGMTITGITGLGKSHEIKRALSLIPQDIVHQRSDAAGWLTMNQISWLYVAMSHDGTLGGLMLQILYALDEVLGTQYSMDKSLTGSSNEKLAVRLGIIFRNHGLGVLVIDELQSRNFEGRGLGRFAATFFLRLLNIGIPVVLIGNPLGLSALYAYSQDVRRVGSGGSIEFHPHHQSGFDWDECIAPSLWRQSVMPEPDQIANRNQLLFKYSGGIRDFACRVRFCSQRIALDLGSSYVSEEHMKQAFYGSDFSNKERDIVAGFRDKNPIPLIQFEDIPWEDYAAKWGLRLVAGKFVSATDNDEKTEQGSDDHSAVETSQSSATRSVPEALAAKAKRLRTQKANKESKRIATKNSVKPEDMRGDGLKEHLIEGLDAVC